MNRNLPIGIDIHRDGVRALQLTAGHRTLDVRAATQLAAPPARRLTGAVEDLEVLGPVIRALVDQRVFKGNQAVVSLPHDYLYAFPVTVEAIGHHAFEEALVQACAKHLAFPLEQAIIDYFSVQGVSSDGDRQRRVSVVAANREQILKVIRTFKQAGLKLNIIDYGLCALIRLHSRIHALSAAPSVMVHVGRETTLLAVVTKTNIVAHRQLDWGIGRLQRRIAETLQLDEKSSQPLVMIRDYGVAYDGLRDGEDQAEKKEMSPHVDDIAALRMVSQILAPHMEELAQELFQIIGYARSESPDIQFQELWLYGMANEIKNLGPFLEKRLHIPAQSMDPFEKLNLHNAGAMAVTEMNAYIFALGLALREAA
jgi:type IV pilus assembly protein PilM